MEVIAKLKPGFRFFEHPYILTSDEDRNHFLAVN